VSDFLKYKDYQGSVEFSSEDRLFFGKVLFIDSLLMFHGSSVEEIEKSFHDTVDAYIKYCTKNGKPLNKPYSGSFNVRVGPEMHKQAAQTAASLGISLNQYIINTLQHNLGTMTTGPMVVNKPYLPYLVANIANSPQTTSAVTSSAALNYDELLKPYLPYLQNQPTRH
jgi:predicted HicB family RNase H-like nuclease